ncbi:SAC3 domain-containing protein 1 [Xenopus tropicalis]|uniref:SAC3 domain containing 1 n=1 Tax=Xenopus tropicalis TaxID=8364 RepID=A0A6I8PU88_XENTR|nr:SAC3 domain-containing protein 1 [Xenopus tropicalis]XP_004913726.1 SAC3 domain-containing protein 1 [Xenopus tropicalis]XP_031756474.1 SAC3 domain-containing protein 1 [Xenopus tropicalis]|eukprot:XP_002937549.2 PREDICTED: SAC3 domain-containing protein 1 [Xenopus tropicalis]
MDQSSTAPVGLCPDMCPRKERQERERQGLLHHFETTDGQRARRGRRGKASMCADPAKTVKEYSRPAAGKELSSPYDIRPPAVLLKTVRYLLMKVWDSVNEMDSVNLSEAYCFVFDRLRAVRQDMTVQRVRGQLGAVVLEESLGFLLCAPYLVRHLPVESYDEVLHATQVRESFAELMECYKEDVRHPREAEFQALLLLYDLGNLDTMNRALKLHHRIGDAPQVRLAMDVNRAYLECNWVRLFRLLHRLDCLQSCAFYRHLTTCRDKNLRMLIHAYSSKNCRFPLDLLARLMAVDSQETVAEMCRRRGLSLAPGGQLAVVFLKSSFKDVVPEIHGREILLVERKKREQTWAGVMMGEEETMPLAHSPEELQHEWH